jgi:cation:H+ antiporter
MPVAFTSPGRALLVMGMGAVGLMIAGLASSVAAWGQWGWSPARRAILQWIPVAATVIVALCLGQTDVALGVIFGTSVAFLSTTMGAVSTVAPVGPAPARWKRIWPFTLAAALIVFMSGFNGLLTWKHGLALALEGLALWPLWRDTSSDADWHPAPRDPAPMIAVDPTIAWLAVIVAILIAIAGGYAAIRGAEFMSHVSVRVSAGAIGASLLSLMIVSPTVQGARRLASLGASWVPVTAQVGSVLLNLCVLVPIVAFTPYVSAWHGALRWHGGLSVDWSAYAPHATVFPLAAWRVDATVLVILSVLFLPVAMGKWNMGKEEGAILIVGYCFYLMAVMAAGV